MNRSREPALGQRPEAQPARPRVDEVFQPARLERAADEVEVAARLRELGDAGGGGDLEVAEVAGEDQHALAAGVRFAQHILVLDARQPGARRRRQQRKPEELDDQAPDVGIVRLREPHDLVFGHAGAEDPAHVLQHHCAPIWQEAVDQLPGQRDRCAQRERERDGRGAGAVMGQRQRDALQPVAGQRVERSRCALDLRCAVVVAGDRKVGDADRPQRGLAREQLQARLLRSEARGQAGGAAGALAAVLPFPLGEDLEQVFGRGLAQQALDAGDLDRVDAAALRRVRPWPVEGPI